MNTQTADFMTQQCVAKARNILEQFRLRVGTFPIKATDGESQLAANVQAGLLTIGREIGDALNRIHADRTLTDLGKREKHKDLAKSLRPRVDGLEKAIMPRLEKKLSNLRSDLNRPLEGTTDAVGAVRQMEIRNRLHGMDDMGRLDLLWKAVSENDAETLAAFQSAPKAFKLVDDASLGEAMSEFRRRQAPELAEAIETLEGIVQVVETDLRGMYAVINSISGGDPAPEEQMADGDDRSSSKDKVGNHGARDQDVAGAEDGDAGA